MAKGTKGVEDRKEAVRQGANNDFFKNIFYVRVLGSLPLWALSSVKVFIFRSHPQSKRKILKIGLIEPFYIHRTQQLLYFAARQINSTTKSKEVAYEGKTEL